VIELILIHLQLTYKCLQVVVDTSIFWYSAYKKYVEDPECYDRRSEKSKIKNGKKLKIKRDFPVSSNTNNVLLLQPLLLHYYYFYNTILYSLLVVSCSAPNNPMAQFHVDSMFVSI
jgi:hypothetical protein